MSVDLDHLAALRREGSRFGEVLADADPTAGVPACADWTVLGLAQHLGRVHRWATANVLAGGARGTRPGDPEPGTDVHAWYAEGLAGLLAALDDPDRPCWTFLGPATAAWWARRQALETLVHRVDAEQAATRPSPVDDDLAADGIAEVVDLLHPARLAQGAVDPPEVGLVLTDPGGARRWVVQGPGPEATVTGPAPALLLLLWGRTALDDPALDVSDPARAALALRGSLTP